MKYREFHKFILKNRWKFSHAVGSHYFYKKHGILSPPVPYHGSKEIGKGLERKISKDMGLE